MYVSKTKLEGLFADELALLQPSSGYMRLLKESVLQIWKARKAAVREKLATAERAAKAVQDKLDRLDEAFLFERSIDIETYDRHAEKLREELTLARIDRHSGQPQADRTGSPLEMTLREGPARTRFQVALETDGRTFVGEFNNHMPTPGSTRRGMRAAAHVVVHQSSVNIG